MKESTNKVKYILSTLKLINTGLFFSTYRLKINNRKYNISVLSNKRYLIEDVTRSKQILKVMNSSDEFIKWYNELQL